MYKHNRILIGVIKKIQNDRSFKKFIRKNFELGLYYRKLPRLKKILSRFHLNQVQLPMQL